MANTNTNNTTAATTTTTAIDLVKFIERIGIENIYSGGRCEACPFIATCDPSDDCLSFGNTPIYYDEKRGESQKLPSFIMKGSEIIKLPTLYRNPPIINDKLYEVEIHTDHSYYAGEETHRYELSYEEV